jgi:predicted regulator of Ras-like GTPase activity (Roadblock/LC7/MglB family)
MSASPFEGVLALLIRQRGVLGCLVVGEADGIVVDANVQVGIQSNVVAALAAALYRKARLCSAAAGLSTVSFLQLEAERGHICAIGRDGLVLVTLAEPRAHIGRIRGAMLESLGALA